MLGLARGDDGKIAAGAGEPVGHVEAYAAGVGNGVALDGERQHGEADGGTGRRRAPLPVSERQERGGGGESAALQQEAAWLQRGAHRFGRGIAVFRERGDTFFYQPAP